MVKIVTPEMGNSGGRDFTPVSGSGEIAYDYPNGLKLKPGSELHERIVKEITNRAMDSYEKISGRHDSWREIDKTMTNYIPHSDYEKRLRKSHREDEQVHPETRPISIVVPTSYAMEDTVLTYFTRAFLNDPVFSYMERGGEDVIAAKMLELLIHYQTQRSRAALDLYAAMKDNMRYGICGTIVGWKEEWALRPSMRKSPIITPFGDVAGETVEKHLEERKVYEGMDLINLDPYKTLPDPNVSIHRIRDGEFFGWVEISNLSAMRIRENNGEFFNVEYLRRGGSAQVETAFTTDDSHRLRFMKMDGEGFRTSDMSTSKTTLINMYVLLSPREWKIGKESLPEWWLFTISDERVLVKMERVDLYHGRFPVAVGASEFDGYTPTPISRLEVIHGVQSAMNWMMNSHVANVRKAINDMIVYDPSLINRRDIESPEPGKLIKLRRKAWGLGIKDAIMQLTVNDITRGNVVDMNVLSELIQRTSAASDPMQGVVRSGGERRSATEYRSTVAGSASRLERAAWVISQMYMTDIAYFAAMHTQQFMEDETYVKILGDWPEELIAEYGQGANVPIGPADIMVDFDIIPKDGTTALSGAENIDSWVQIFNTMATQPAIGMQFDVVRIFYHMARLMGAKNLHQFRAQANVQVQSDEVVQDQARRGNIIPIQEALRG